MKLLFPLSCSESEVAQSCPTLCDPMDCSLPCSSIHGIFQARVLEWVAISFSRGSSRPRDRTQVSRIVGRCFTIWATREVYYAITHLQINLAALIQLNDVLETVLIPVFGNRNSFSLFPPRKTHPPSLPQIPYLTGEPSEMDVWLCVHMQGVVEGELGKGHMYAIREDRTGFNTFPNEHTNCTLYLSRPQISHLPTLPGKSDEWSQSLCTALSALGPKAPEEEGWHQKELEVTGSSVLCDDPDGWDGGSGGRG